MTDGASTSMIRQSVKSAPSTSYIRALRRVSECASPELETLRKRWPAVMRLLVDRRKRLRGRIPVGDPLWFQTDLLGPLARTQDESSHSRALAFILDPRAGHGFGKAPLIEMLKRFKKRRNVEAALQLLGRRDCDVNVEREYHHSVTGAVDRDVARNDIRIEIKSRATKILIILENKIGSAEGRDQLFWYKSEARRWCESNGGKAILIYLTPARRLTKSAAGWMDLSYALMAGSFRRVWLVHRHTASGAWLALYISSVMKGVLGLNPKKLHDLAVSDIVEYLDGSL
ncbi:MAG: hypothetical protein GC204_09300 [Chloroflexi bacterium]|nr:hypothetical protein [Chloroflexota bacterium]